MSDYFDGILTVTGTGAEVRVTPNGSELLKFRGKVKGTEDRFLSVAVWLDGGWVEPNWLAESLTKGALVAVSGTVKERTYATRDGAERTDEEVTAFAIGPLYRKPKRA